jgi:rhodanese-related sulfurtransferase
MSATTIVNILLGAFLVWSIYRMVAPVKGMTTLNAGQFKERLHANKGALLIDVREVNEFKGGSIPKAVNIPLSQLKSRMNEIPMDKEVFVFCKSGMRSKKAAAMISAKGHRQIVNLQGGIMSWKG